VSITRWPSAVAFVSAFCSSGWLVCLCALVFLFLLAMVRPCNAIPSLDQSFTTPGDLAAVINDCCAFVAQTYTAGLSGTLAAVAIDVQSLSSSPGFPLHVAVRGVTGETPNSLILGETTLSSSSAPLSLLIAFSQAIEQVAGEQYALAVNYVGAPPPGAFQSQGVWIGSDGNFYTGGDTFVSLNGTSWFRDAGNDLHFQTFVESVPEPTTLFLFGVVAAGFGIASWGQRRRK
jgi:hypothetical protein